MAEFYAARSWEIPPLPWTNLSPPFSNFHLKEDRSSHDSIAPIEITVFSNGYVALVIRVTNVNYISDFTVLDLIKHPEFVLDDQKLFESELTTENGQPGLKSGDLIKVLYETVTNIHKEVMSYISREKIEILSFENGSWEEFSGIELDTSVPGKRWTRPYIGVHFRPSEKWDESDDTNDSIKCFVVAAGRSTPQFLQGFDEVHDYLEAGKRNVYGAGGSIVYVGRRGWCVFNSGNQNSLSFTFGIVEIAHLSLMTIDTATRSRRRFLGS